MRNTCRIFICIIVALLAFSCGVGRKQRPGKDQDKRTRYEYKLEDLGLLEDDGVVTSGVPEAVETEKSGDIDLAPRRNGDNPEDDQFFSAQVFASKSSSEARDFKESIDPLFEDEVRIDYQAPYYKVCVGNVQGFEEAQELLKRVNAMGFTRAWLVKLRK
jgi:hypothetical protein